MAPKSNLVCKECGYVNEAERVYCHGCGAKLDRTVILAEQERNAVSREERQRQVKKMMTPRGSSFVSRELSMLCKILVWSPIAALFVLILLPPKAAPALPKKGEALNLPQLGDDLERLTRTPAGQGYIFKETDINTYLLKKPFRKVPTWFTDIIPLRRSFVNLDNGQARLTVQADLAGYPLYVGITATPKNDPQSGLSATWTAFHIGRLNLPGIVARQAAAAVPTVMDSVKRDIQLLGQLGSAEITPGQLVLRSRGPVPPTLPNAAGSLPAVR